MKIGVCASPDKLPLLSGLRYDYIETNFSWMMSLDGEEFRRQTALIERNGLPSETFNIFFRGGMKLYALSNGVPAMLVGVNPYFHIAILMMILGCMLFLAGFLAELIIRNSPSRNDYLIKETL